MKVKCSLCREYKEPTEFYWRDKEHQKKSSYCKKCSNLLSKEKHRIMKERVVSA